ncbi:Uncharacterized protein BM_BM374 [Brugia malayi]|uniref:Bm374 n=1 Tax=Brugia malayi TaxID=6279 RepID=A0A0H5S4S5_BRUMA|nr:Uncharacterized protein BM_BM374 [Brugia malayi]CRZ23701.1 Bm374 [Brugia malayi]VIO93418.1 Uncharacterized protein BM_BM374 [Brugia malayi]
MYQSVKYFFLFFYGCYILREANSRIQGKKE